MEIGLQIFLVLTLIGTIFTLVLRKKINDQLSRVALLSSIVGIVLVIFQTIETGLTQYTLLLGLFFLFTGALGTVQLFRNRQKQV